MPRPNGFTRGWRIASATLGVVVVLGAGAAAYGWYYEHYVWPRKIQVEVLGEVIVDHEAFRSFERSSHWGQGMFRWKFSAPSAPGSAWMKHCGSQPINECAFIESKRPESQVETSVSYKDGVVTIEEWWM